MDLKLTANKKLANAITNVSAPAIASAAAFTVLILTSAGSPDVIYFLLALFFGTPFTGYIWAEFTSNAGQLSPSTPFLVFEIASITTKAV